MVLLSAIQIIYLISVNTCLTWMGTLIQMALQWIQSRSFCVTENLMKLFPCNMLWQILLDGNEQQNKCRIQTVSCVMIAFAWPVENRVKWPDQDAKKKRHALHVLYCLAAFYFKHILQFYLTHIEKNTLATVPVTQPWKTGKHTARVQWQLWYLSIYGSNNSSANGRKRYVGNGFSLWLRQC